MKFIVIEDEKIAADRLKKIISEIRPGFKHLLTLDSIESAVISLPPLRPDVIFMDIRLADGLSFEIFDQIELKAPIIFTTAYDNYAIQAFKINSIDYLLKPIDPEELENAILKLEQRLEEQKQQSEPVNEPDRDINNLIKTMQPGGKERFVVKVGDRLKSIKTEDIQLIYSSDKTTYLFTDEKRRYPIDFTVEKVDDLLSKEKFFKISRKFIVNIDFIGDIISFTNSRLEILINGFEEERVIVARERVSDFKFWLDR